MNLSMIKKNLFTEVTAIPDVLNQKYLPSLDGFRALAIILTIFTHVTQTHFGALGVQAFFVISGFLITTLLLKEKLNKGGIALKKFYIRRFFRIIPVAWLYCLVVVIVNIVTHFQIPLISYLSAFLFFRNIYSDSWLYGHYWSISVEEQYYIIFPSILKRASLKTYILFLLSFLGVILLISYFSGYFFSFKTNTSKHDVGHYVHYIVFLTKFDGIIIGSLFSIIAFKQFITYKITKPLKYISCLTIPVLIFLIAKFSDSIWNMPVISVLVCVLINMNLTYSDDYVFRFLNSKLMKHIGVLSYSLYIWQQLFTFIRPWAHAFPYSDSLILNMVALYVVAYVSYNYFEKPFFKLRAKYA